MIAICGEKNGSRLILTFAKTQGALISSEIASDFDIRLFAFTIGEDRTETDIVPICRTRIPAIYLESAGVAKDVMEVAVQQFPVPSPICPWQDIFGFKQEMHDKQWTFRRFLSELATKEKTECEVVDEIEYLLNDYIKAMDRYKLQRSISFWETYIIPTVEAFESLRPSGVLKGIVAIKKRKLVLMECEAKQDGSPIAYVFEAQKRFGSPR